MLIFYVFGHTHKPYHRILQSEASNTNHYRHAINIGSVGKPKDGNPFGCYVLLTINAESSIENKDAIKVEFIRFDYNVERAAKAIEDSPLPNEFADMLRKSILILARIFKSFKNQIELIKSVSY